VPTVLRRGGARQSQGQTNGGRRVTDLCQCPLADCQSPTLADCHTPTGGGGGNQTGGVVIQQQLHPTHTCVTERSARDLLNKCARSPPPPPMIRFEDAPLQHPSPLSVHAHTYTPRLTEERGKVGSAVQDWERECGAKEVSFQNSVDVSVMCLFAWYLLNPYLPQGVWSRAPFASEKEEY